MRRRTLRQVLMRYWLAFALVTGAAALGAAAVIAYTVEDRIIDRRLLDVAMSVLAGTSDAESLPQGFSLYREPAMPVDIGAQLVSARSGDIREFGRAGGAYVHAMVIGESGRRRYLVYEVSDALVVGPNMLASAMVALACLALFIAISAIVARELGRRAENEGARLLYALSDCQTPDDVRRLAEAQEMQEMHAFLSTHAGVWDERTRALREQQELVSYLAHELRTPLQSAQTSLAVLRDDTPNSPGLARLDRAVSRLARASQATLFLAGEFPPTARSALPLVALWDELRTEFRPLAEYRGLTIAAGSGTDPLPLAPREAVEAVLSNLLANAIQHGGPGTITFQAREDGFSVVNPVGDGDSPGFGLGQIIVERLCERLRWTADSSKTDDRFEARIMLLDGDAP